MLDEPGSNYRPRIVRVAPQAPAQPAPAQESPAARPTPAAAAIPLLRRPLWVSLTASFLVFSAMMRLCSLSLVESPAATIGYLASTVTLGVTALGLMGMRRWGVWLLLCYCAWAMLSVIGVGVYRISVIMNEVDIAFHRDQLIFQEILMNMCLGFFFYGILGLWFFLQRRRFILPSSAWSVRANVSFILLVSALLLYSASQISNAPHEIRQREEQLVQSQGATQDFLNNLFGTDN